jgi:hypothetical protein
MHKSQDFTVDLSGNWEFLADSSDTGIPEAWWNRELPNEIQLPGSMQEQGFGYNLTADLPYTAASYAVDDWKLKTIYSPYREPGRVQLSWALTPEKFYVGSAWYRREFRIPESWNGSPVRLFLERCHWVSSVWVDGNSVGEQNSLSVPHTYNLGNLKDGTHNLVIRIDNRMLVPVGMNAQALTDMTQTNWNGIVGKLELIRMQELELSRLTLHPDASKKQVRIQVHIVNHSGNAGQGVLSMVARTQGSDPYLVPEASFPVNWTASGGDAEILLNLGEGAPCWDEFSPVLFDLMAVVSTGEKQVAIRHETFGLRTVEIRDKQIILNSRRIFLRGTLENMLFPMTGFPPMDADTWKKEFSKIKSYGMNHIRFHSSCPPEAAFIAADELGLYLQVEGPAWAEVEKNSDVAEYLMQETRRILDQYGNHPSFLMFACGNEFSGSSGGKTYIPPSLLPHQAMPPEPVLKALGSEFLSQWVVFIKGLTDRQLISSSAGWPYLAENDYHIMHEPFRMRYVFNKLSPSTRIDYANLVKAHPVPIVSHETGQWCTYPDFSRKTDYSGFLKALNLEIYREFARKNGLEPFARDYAEASGQFQVILYKEEIEAQLRTPGEAGFQLLGLQDYPGHGLAPVGVMDAFWNQKPYVSQEGFRRFCGPVVLLALMDKRIWINSETFSAALEVAQFGKENIEDAKIIWEIRDTRNTMMETDTIDAKLLQKGTLVSVGQVKMDLSAARKAMKMKLQAKIDGSSWVNDWDFWVYPHSVDTIVPSAVCIITDTGSALQEAVDRGEKILFVPGKEQVKAVDPGLFEPLFWSTVDGTGTLGILCRNNHLAFALFPTGNHADWQWWELLRTSLPINITGVQALEDIPLQVIDNWVRAYKLGLIFECRIDNSQILVCALDIVNDLEKRPVARQLRYSLLNYLAGRPSHPISDISLQTLRDIISGRIPLTRTH